MARNRNAPRRDESDRVDPAHAIAGMSHRHLLCRDFGHSWRPYDVQVVPQRRHYVETLLCTRCKTARRRLIDFDGAQLGSGYVYADGYLIHGMGRLTGDDRNGLRLAALRSVMDRMGVDGGT